VERSSFTFQPRRPLQLDASAQWWIWIPLVLVIGGIVAVSLLGHASSNSHSSPYTTAKPPADEIQVVDRSLGNGWYLQAFDDSPAGPTSQPRIAYDLINDSASMTISRGPLPFGTTPHLTVPGLSLMRGDPDGEDDSGPPWRWTTFYEVSDPSITAVRAVFAGRVVDSMKPVKLDDIRFVILSADEDASRVHVEGLSRTGRVLASIPLADPTYGRAVP
jgi:hypothetical protein